ncbi:MAG: class I SAM-dependent methyltransferase [Roseburia sp.]|nr:class I SAM-dependent methyltransferase [Roseburia sp.]
MKNMNDTAVVKQQYKNADKLNIRIALHEKYSTNKVPFGDWIVSNYDIKQGSRVLELGCGTGSIWNNNLHLLDNGSEIVLSDFSEGMLNTARKNLGEHPNLSYQVIDIQDIPFEDNTFDVIIANMMLYHVPDLKKGLSEVARVLKEDGTFYCATYGENGIIQYIESLLKEYGVKDDMNKLFTLQNGTGILAEHFEKVQRLDREDGLQLQI